MSRRYKGLEWLALWLVAIVLIANVAAAQEMVGAKPVSGEFASPTEAVVSVWGREIAVLRAPYGAFSASERAASAVENIKAIPFAVNYRIEVLKATEGNLKGAWIKVNGQRVFGVLTDDVDTERGESFDEYLAKLTANLQQWLAVRSEQYRAPLLIRSVLLTAVATIAFFTTIWLMLRYSHRWTSRREQMAKDPMRNLTIRTVNMRPYIVALEVGFFKLLVWSAGLFLAYIWLAFALNNFPYSQAWAASLRNFLLDLCERFGLAMLRAVPNLFTVFVILLIARFFSKLIQTFFQSAERGYRESILIDPETARATRRLLSVLIWIFAMIVAYPYIPGSDTAAFKGVSVFFGLMVSLGSAGMVGQVVGGLVVVYSRAFRTGDHVKVGEHEGLVREVGVLSTKLETRMREEVTIPNAVLLGATTINYSRLARDQGAALVMTQVTIGYDTPWRQVHAMLKTAAARTAQIKITPEPRILQRALSDFYPEYALIFAIGRSEERYAVLSELHGHIQDVFNEHGVQIMSPNFVAQPAEPVLAKPGPWRSEMGDAS